MSGKTGWCDSQGAAQHALCRRPETCTCTAPECVHASATTTEEEADD